MTVFVWEEMVNFPAPQKLDPKISPHGTGIHIVYDSVCGAGNGQFSFPTKTRPKISPHGIHMYSHCFPNMREKGFNTELVKMKGIVFYDVFCNSDAKN